MMNRCNSNAINRGSLAVPALPGRLGLLVTFLPLLASAGGGVKQNRLQHVCDTLTNDALLAAVFWSKQAETPTDEIKKELAKKEFPDFTDACNSESDKNGFVQDLAAKYKKTLEGPKTIMYKKPEAAGHNGYNYIRIEDAYEDKDLNAYYGPNAVKYGFTGIVYYNYGFIGYGGPEILYTLSSGGTKVASYDDCDTLTDDALLAAVFWSKQAKTPADKIKEELAKKEFPDFTDACNSASNKNFFLQDLEYAAAKYKNTLEKKPILYVRDHVKGNDASHYVNIDTYFDKDLNAYFGNCDYFFAKAGIANEHDLKCNHGPYGFIGIGIANEGIARDVKSDSPKTKEEDLTA